MRAADRVPESLTVEVERDPRSKVTTGRLRALLVSPVAALAEAADPQRWCLTRYFPESHKVVKSARGYERDPDPPRPGTGWKGQLLEHFQWRVGGLSICAFRNVLNIDYRVTSDELHLTYSLHRPLGGSAWFTPASVGVDVDSGHLIARQTRAATELEVVKSVRFVTLDRPQDGVAGGALNRFTPIALGFWLRAVAAPWTSR